MWFHSTLILLNSITGSNTFVSLNILEEWQSFKFSWLTTYFLRYIYIYIYIYTCIKVKVKWSRYRPGVAHRMGRGIALLFYDRGTRRGWVLSSTPRPHFTPGKDPVPILQETGWAPGPVWTGENSRPHRDSTPDRPARSQSLYQLRYPGHKVSK